MCIDVLTTANIYPLTSLKTKTALLQGRDKTPAGKSRARSADKKMLSETEAAPSPGVRPLQTCHNVPVTKVHPVNPFLADFGRKFIQIE